MKYEVIYESEPEEVETNILFQKLRDGLGYGKAWKFLDALWDTVFPFIPVIILICVFVFIITHFRIVWVE
jgi:hypothetical protein